MDSGSSSDISSRLTVCTLLCLPSCYPAYTILIIANATYFVLDLGVLLLDLDHLELLDFLKQVNKSKHEHIVMNILRDVIQQPIVVQIHDAALAHCLFKACICLCDLFHDFFNFGLVEVTKYPDIILLHFTLPEGLQLLRVQQRQIVFPHGRIKLRGQL